MSRSARPCSAACGRARTTQAACPYNAKPVTLFQRLLCDDFTGTPEA